MSKIIILIATFLTSFSYANMNEDFSMLPLRFEETMKVGETKEFTLNIRNEMKVKKMKEYILKISEFNLTSEGALNLKDSKTKNSRSLVPYVRLSNDKIEIEPGKDIKIKVIVSIPKDYKKGSGYFVFTLSKDLELIKQRYKINGAVFMKTLTGFFAINVVENKSLSVEILKAKYENNRLVINLKNTGEFYLKTAGKAVILDQSNKKIGVFELVDSKNRAEFLSFPENEREVSAAIPASVLKGLKNLKVNITVSDVKNDFISNKILDLKLGK